jgi:ribokinase
MGRVVVIGSTNQDHVVVVDRRPRAGQTVTGATVTTHPGGKGANQAVAAAACGARVHLVARVGDDPAGVAQREDLTRCGVDVSLVTVTPGLATGTAFITVTPDGENTVIVAPGANAALGTSDIDAGADVIAESSVLVAQLEVTLEAVAEAIARCGPGTHVVLNAAPFCPLPESLLQRVDTLVVNESEAASLVGSPVTGPTAAGDAAAAIVDRGPRTVIVTLGASGAVMADGDGWTHVPAPRVPVVDTTGAGDVFVGTLAALLSDGQEMRSAVAVAVGRASASVAYVGARSPGPAQSGGNGS